jgi:hypothetical protein
VSEYHDLIQLMEEMLSGRNANRTSTIITRLVQYIITSWRYIHVSMYVYIYIYKCINTYKWITHTDVDTRYFIFHIYIYIYIYIWTYLYMYTYIYTSIYIYICIYVGFISLVQWPWSSIVSSLCLSSMISLLIYAISWILCTIQVFKSILIYIYVYT